MSYFCFPIVPHPHIYTFINIQIIHSHKLRSRPSIKTTFRKTLPLNLIGISIFETLYYLFKGFIRLKFLKISIKKLFLVLS